MTIEEVPQDDLPQEADVTDWKSEYEKANKSYSELRKVMDSSIRRPQPDASEEDWQSYYKKIGVPDSPDGYTVPETDDNGLREILDNLRGTARKIGMTPDKFNTLASEAINAQKARVAALTEEFQNWQQEREKEAKKELGEEGFEEVMARAKRLENELYTDEERDFMEKLGLNRMPGYLKAMQKLAKAHSNAQIPESSGGMRGMEDTDRALAQKWLQLQYSPALQEKNHPMRSKASQESMAIVEQLTQNGHSSVHDLLQPEDYMGLEMPKKERPEIRPVAPGRFKI